MPAAEIRLRILQTSDIHGALRGYDYLADRPSGTRGLSRTASLMASARAQVDNSLLFDSGDLIQGSPLCDLVADRGLAPGQIHPMIAAMNALNYDAFAPGNHDFNHGPGLLLRALEGAVFPAVCANFLYRDTQEPVFAPYRVLTRRFTDTSGTSHDLRIGVVGCLPPQTTEWDHELAEDFITAGMVEATRTAAHAARAEGCDLVVILAHTGIDPAASGPRAENAVIELAGLPDIDLVLCGHTHLLFPAPMTKGLAHPAIDVDAGTIHGKPVMMPGFGGNHLGQMDLVLTPDAAGRWAIGAHQSTLLPLARRDALGSLIDITPEDPDICALSDAAHRATLDYVHEPLGETCQALNSFFSLVGNDTATQIVATAQATHLHGLVRGTPLGDLPILSVAAPFKTGHRGGPRHYTNISPGVLSRRSLTDLYVYPNMFCAVSLDGAHLREWLEQSACLFSHLPPGSPPDQPLLDDSFPGYRFDIILGLRYDIDLSQSPRYDPHGRMLDPSARRIRNLTYQGAPLDTNQRFLLATNTYRAYGVGLPPPGPDGPDGPRTPPRVELEDAMTNRDILRSYIAANSPLNLTPEPIWSFAPLGGVTAVFQTSPQAREHLLASGLPGLDDLGNTPDGFANFRITL